MVPTRTPLRLFEAERERVAWRKASHGYDPEATTRHAYERLRSGHDPHEVALDAYRVSPESHRELVGRLHPDDHRRRVMAVAPHLHTHHVLADQARAEAKKSTLGFLTKKAARLRAQSSHALSEFMRTAKEAGRKPHELFSPKVGEPGVLHRHRLLRTFGGAERDGASGLAGQIRYRASIRDPKLRDKGAKAVNHWYGDTHDIEHIPASSNEANATDYFVRRKEKS